MREHALTLINGSQLNPIAVSFRAKKLFGAYERCNGYFDSSVLVI